MQLEFLVDS